MTIEIDKDDTSTVSSITVSNGSVHIVARGNSEIGKVHVGSAELAKSKGKTITASSGDELHGAFKALGDAIVDKHVDSVFGAGYKLLLFVYSLIVVGVIVAWAMYLIP